MAELRAEALRTVVLQALRDEIKNETEFARGEVLVELTKLWREVGVKSLDVKLPDGLTVATVTLVEPSPAIVVVDRPAFVAWVQKRAPEMVTWDESPLDRVARIVRGRFDGDTDTAGRQAYADKWAVDVALNVLAALGINPDRPDPRVSRSYEEALLAELVPVDLDPDLLPRSDLGEAVLPETGEIVPGVEYRPAGDPTKIQVNYKPSSEKGRRAIAEAWRTGRLPAIEGLPGIEA